MLIYKMKMVQSQIWEKSLATNKKEIKMEVNVGDNVIYSKYSGTDVKIDEEEYIIVRQADILAVVK